MMRYHFDIQDGSTMKKDDEGIEFADIAEMQEDAIRAAGCMIGEKTIFPSELWAMNIRDNDCKTVAILTFSAVQVG